MSTATYSEMFAALPTSAAEFMDWSWAQIQPYYVALNSRSLTPETIGTWLADWSRLSELVDETRERLYVATTRNTADEAIQKRYEQFLDVISPPSQEADQQLKQRLLDSNLSPTDFAIPLRNMRAEAQLFRDANLPLLNAERKLYADYDRIQGAQTIQWEGEEKPLIKIYPLLKSPDRTVREKAWRAIATRVIADRPAVDEMWRKFLNLRRQIARNADLPDYRAYRWRQMLRFDYTPADCIRFHEAIEQVVVPAASRLAARRRQQLALESLRPWDMSVDPQSRPPLHPFESITELQDKTGAIFRQLDPEFGAYFETMRHEDLLDLDVRKNKAAGGYCLTFSASRRPFIFVNGINIHGTVQTMLHEGGHAFHVFESAGLPYFQQRVERQVPLEFAEVASMAMELIAGKYLALDGGFYNAADAAFARREVLGGLLTFWPYMSVVDLFQHWIYENPDAASDSAACDAKWAELYRRFRPHEDWTDLEQYLGSIWRQQSHILQDPFYFVEYGMAQLGAVQVWHNALHDQADALRRYRKALALGGSAALPQLYQTAGAKFQFDAATLQEAVDLIENTLKELDTVH